MERGNYKTVPIAVKAAQYLGTNLSEVIEVTQADLRESPMGGLFLFIGNKATERVEYGDWIVRAEDHTAIYEPEEFDKFFEKSEGND